MAKKEKSTFLTYLEFIPFLFLYGLMHLIPLKAAYAMSDVLFTLLYYLDAKHRKRTIQHILHAGVQTDPVEAARMARRVFRNFGKLLVEIVKMRQCYHVDKISVSGDPETIAEAGKREGNNAQVILITAHYGNWEVAGTAWTEYTRTEMTSIMRPFGNRLIGNLIINHRQSKTHALVDRGGGIRTLLQAIKAKRTIAILIDQYALAQKEGVETTFFGQPCRTHMSPAQLHLKTGIPIMPMVTRRMDHDYHFDIEVGKMLRYTPTGDKEKDIQILTQQCTDELQKLIMRDPDQWLWAHRRWSNINR